MIRTPLHDLVILAPLIYRVKNWLIQFEFPRFAIVIVLDCPELIPELHRNLMRSITYTGND